MHDRLTTPSSRPRPGSASPGGRPTNASAPESSMRSLSARGSSFPPTWSTPSSASANPRRHHRTSSARWRWPTGSPDLPRSGRPGRAIGWRRCASPSAGASTPPSSTWWPSATSPRRRSSSPKGLRRRAPRPARLDDRRRLPPINPPDRGPPRRGPRAASAPAGVSGHLVARGERTRAERSPPDPRRGRWIPPSPGEDDLRLAAQGTRSEGAPGGTLRPVPPKRPGRLARHVRRPGPLPRSWLAAHGRLSRMAHQWIDMKPLVVS